MKTKISLTKKIIGFIFLFFITTNFFGQIYLRGIGVKVGGYSAYMAISYKEHLTQRISIEANLGKNVHSEYKNFSLQLMVQLNQKFRKARGLSWYAGIGPSAFYWYNCYGTNDGRKSYLNKPTKYRAVMNSVLGLECIVANSPFSVSLDAGPSFFVYPYTITKWMVNGSVKYIVRNNKFTAHYRLSRKAFTKGRASF
ncbi:MAG: hypothetical protein HYU67_13610 [Flavobacteriia bacterium]|nr:hypothetical protein [Flavobacteriia bacterium]